MRGVNPTLQSMFQAAHMGKGGVYDGQGSKMKKKQSMMLHSDPSILGGLPFHPPSEGHTVSFRSAGTAAFNQVVLDRLCEVGPKMIECFI